MPELNWFSSSTDLEDKYGYLGILQILGFLANAMQEQSVTFTSLIELFDELRVKRNEMYGDIKNDIWKVENELRNIERDEITLAKEKMLANNTITIPREANRLSELTTGAGKWKTKRFTHLEWVENKGGKTYTVKGYLDLARWEKGPEQHFEHFKVKKSYLQSAIDDAFNCIAKHEKELAETTVQA